MQNLLPLDVWNASSEKLKRPHGPAGPKIWTRGSKRTDKREILSIQPSHVAFLTTKPVVGKMTG